MIARRSASGAALWGSGAEVALVRAALERVQRDAGPDPLSQIERYLLTGRGDEEWVLGCWEGLLGGGLPGRRDPELDPTELAQLVAATGLLPESGTRRGGAVLAAAQVATRRLLARYPQDPDVLAWLVLAQQD